MGSKPAKDIYFLILRYQLEIALKVKKTRNRYSYEVKLPLINKITIWIETLIG